MKFNDYDQFFKLTNSSMYGIMCMVNYTIGDCIYNKDLYYHKPYARDVDMLLSELRRGGISA